MTTPIEERVASLEGAYQHLATKEDIAALRGEFKEDIAALRGEFKEGIAGLRGDFNRDYADLRTEIAKAQTSSTRWLIGAMGVFTGIIIAVDRLFG